MASQGRVDHDDEVVRLALHGEVHVEPVLARNDRLGSQFAVLAAQGVRFQELPRDDPRGGREFPHGQLGGGFLARHAPRLGVSSRASSRAASGPIPKLNKRPSVAPSGPPDMKPATTPTERASN